jgi:putative nucleotidyltransferase with HDIG domain
MLVAGLPREWLALAALTLLSGSITVKVPTVPATISVSETFVFTSVLLFGPAAGTLTVALDGLVISFWLRRRQPEVFRAAFNIAAPAVSIWIASNLFYLVAAPGPLSGRPDAPVMPLLLPLAGFTSVYFMLNSWLIALAIAYENQLSALTVWRENFFWLGLNYFGGASVAALLVASSRRIDWTTLGVIVPLLVISYFTYRTAMGRLEDATKHLRELNSLYLSTIETLARAIDARDQVTHDHIRRVQVTTVMLAQRLGVTDEPLLRAIEAAALLHDLGKLTIPEHILNKPGRLTASEFEQIKTHSKVGAEILSSIDFPYPVVPIVRCHHENWDGTGYPDGVAGTDIPIGARILAVVDCFDALTSDRPYRPALSDSEALRILLHRRGTMYDPVVVDAFLETHADLLGSTAPVAGYAPVPNATPADSRSPFVPYLASRDVVTHTPGRPTTQLDESQQCMESQQRSVVEGEPSAASWADVLSIGVYRYDASSDTLTLAHWLGAAGSRLPAVVNPPLAVSRWVARTGESIVNAPAILDLGLAMTHCGLENACCTARPVLRESKAVGVVTVISETFLAIDNSWTGLLDLVGHVVLRQCGSQPVLVRRHSEGVTELRSASPRLPPECEGAFQALDR